MRKRAHDGSSFGMSTIQVGADGRAIAESIKAAKYHHDMS